MRKNKGLKTRQKKTRHHVVPKSREREGFNVHDKRNIKLLKQGVHDALHRLFSNLTPDEQLEFWYSVNEQVLSEYVKGELMEILSLQDKDFYKDWVVR